MERVLPTDLAAAARAEDFFTPDLTQAPAGSDVAFFDDVVELIRRSAIAVGVGTELCLRDYFRLKPAPARAAIAHLEAAGELEPVEVDGFHKLAWRHVDAKTPRRVDAAALLSPFDSLIWQRERTEALFNMRFRLEIYTPAPKREFGYYVLPFLFGEELVARVDLKAERASGTLVAHRVSWEKTPQLSAAREALIAEFNLMAEWLGLGTVRIGEEI